MKHIPERPEQYEPHWLDALPFKSVVALEESETRFLNGVIRAAKPKKSLEVGVHNGGSSMVMLNAIKDDRAAHLYSVDISDVVSFGEHKGKKIGWAVHEHTPGLAKQWSLFSGGQIAEFIDKIPGKEIDLCFLDAAHTLPGEILDFLIVLPYMQKTGIFIIHDTTFDHRTYRDTRVGIVFGVSAIACPVLFAAVRADKIKPFEFNTDILPAANIGAFRINDETWKYIDDVFLALNIKWRHLPNDSDMEYIVKSLEKHYSRKNVDLFLRNYELNKRIGVDWSPLTIPRDCYENLLHQQAAALAGREVYFFGCGATYKAYRRFFAAARPECILVDFPNAPQSVDGIPVKHPGELRNARRLPVIVFARGTHYEAIKEKLQTQYSGLFEGEPVWAIHA